MKVIISSNIDYFPTIYKKISACKAYLQNKSKFTFIVGGDEFNEHQSIDNIMYTNINSMDLNGLIYLIENDYIHLGEDSFFYSQDTCSFGEKFFDLLDQKKKHIDARLFINPRESMYMGIYNRNILNTHSRSILSFRNTSKDRSVMNTLKTNLVNNESFILKNSDYICKRRIVRPPVDIYLNGVPRITEYFPEIDFYKYKANWYLKNYYELNL